MSSRRTWPWWSPWGLLTDRRGRKQGRLSLHMPRDPSAVLGGCSRGALKENSRNDKGGGGSTGTGRREERWSEPEEGGEGERSGGPREPSVLWAPVCRGRSRGTWDIAGLEVQRGTRPQPGGVLRLRGFCTAYVLSGAFFSPRRLLFFVGAASPFAAARKIGKLPEEAPSAQPGLRSARLRGTAVLHVRRRLWPRGRRMTWRGGLGLPSGRRDSRRLRAWGGAAGSGSRQPFPPG